MTTLHKAAREALIDEAMRLAEKMMRDSWATGRDEAWHPSRAALEAHLRAALNEAPGEEPVAWRTFDGEGGFEFRAYEENEDYADQWDARNPRHKGWVEPLYLAARPSAPTVTQKPLTRAQISRASGDAQIAFCLNKQPTYEVAFAREVERLHGIDKEGGA